MPIDRKPCQLTADAHPVTERWCLEHNQPQPQCRIDATRAELEAARKRVVELETEKAGASARADEWEHRFDKLSALAKAERADLEQSLRLERESRERDRTKNAAHAERLLLDVRSAWEEAFQAALGVFDDFMESRWNGMGDRPSSPPAWMFGLRNRLVRRRDAALSDPPHESGT